MTTQADTTTQADENSWMLELIRGVRGVRHVVVLTSDGLLKVRTDNTPLDVADRSRRRAPAWWPWASA
jgi:predicted regulator of Ras-like GTPase activity (Roadblock/LC7/MglB family)